jgi:hypothetical protein
LDQNLCLLSSTLSSLPISANHYFYEIVIKNTMDRMKDDKIVKMFGKLANKKKIIIRKSMVE